MYFSIAGKTEARLIEDDMDGIAHLYPRDELSGQPFGCSAIHATKTVPNYNWAAYGLLLILFNIYLGRRFSKNQT